MIDFLLRWLFGILIATVGLGVGIFLAWLISDYPVIAGILIIVLIGLAFADLID